MDDAEVVPPFVALAQREAACCTFFTFTITIHATALTFAAEVPAEASPVLDELMSALSPVEQETQRPANTVR